MNNKAKELLKKHAHLYIGGAFVQAPNKEIFMLSLNRSDGNYMPVQQLLEDPDLRLKLRPLQEMGEHEAVEMIRLIPFYADKQLRIDDIDQWTIRFRVQYDNARWWRKSQNVNGQTPAQFAYLLSKAFDVLGLIPAGAAVKRFKK